MFQEMDLQKPWMNIYHQYAAGEDRWIQTSNETPQLIDDSDDEGLPSFNKHQHSASTASTSYGCSPDESDIDSDDEQDSLIQELRDAYRSKTRERQDSQAKDRHSSPSYAAPSACIARRVSKDELIANVRALKAQKDEWSKLWDQNVWEISCYKKY